MKKYYYKSPIGILEISYFENFLYSLKITEKLGVSDTNSKFSKNIKTQLDKYFSGEKESFEININPKGTVFQKLVWSELLKIPYGATKSYSEIAKNIGNKKAQRAVGSACNKNPIMIIIPCHRVVSKNGDLGGFAYGNSVKQKLLNIESGVIVN